MTMDQDRAIEVARTMYLQDSRRKEVIEFFNQNGFSEEEAETMATTAYQAVKTERQAILKEQEIEAKKINWKSLLGGAAIVLGSVIVLFVTGRFYYMIAVGGLILIINGFSKTFKI